MWPPKNAYLVHSNFKRIFYTKIMLQCANYGQMLPLDPLHTATFQIIHIKQTNHLPGLSPNSKYMVSNDGQLSIFCISFPNINGVVRTFHSNF